MNNNNENHIKVIGADPDSKFSYVEETTVKTDITASNCVGGDL